MIEVLLVGLVLSADSFSAALAMGFRPHNNKDVLKFATTSGSAEALVTYLGAIAGSQIVMYFDSIDHWISFTLLVGVALHMIYEGVEQLKPVKLKKEAVKFHSFLKVLIVSFATSLDAFAVGVSLGVAARPLTPFVISIGAFAFISTVVGMSIARKVSLKVGSILSFLGALILIGLAFKLL